MPTSIPIMPFVILLLLLLPFKLTPKNLLHLAGILWVIGGTILAWMGITALQESPWYSDLTTYGLAVVGSLLIGFGKGKFVLSKTANKNIERLSELQEPQKPIHVYSLRSWIIISLMVLLSVGLTWFNAPMEWRGVIRLAVGFSLIISSFAYARAGQSIPSSQAI